jgi:hypothetical protein
MKLIVIEHSTGFEVIIRDNTGINQHCYVFNTRKEVEAFCTGFHCAKTTINDLVQSLPMGYDRVEKI